MEKETDNYKCIYEFHQGHINSLVTSPNLNYAVTTGEDGIVKVGSYVKEQEILVGKFTPCEEDSSPETKLLQALYGKPKKSYRDTSLRVPH
jgi:DNA-directed RNA polymerase subunit beta